MLTNYDKVLLPYAYNILGSYEDARDAVQDIITKHMGQSHSNIDNVKNYLIKSVINHAINLKKRYKKFTHEEVWLPEPIATEQADSSLLKSEFLSYSLLVLMERLTPSERAVFMLKEGFNYSHKEIAEVLDSSVENSRKLLSRAKSKISDANIPSNKLNCSTFPQQVFDQYINAIQNKELKQLEKLLTRDIAFYADGGGKINVVSQFTQGQNDVAQLITYVYHQFQKSSTIKLAIINHQPAFLYYKKSKLILCQVFTTTPDNTSIQSIFTILDRDKLKMIENLEIPVTFREAYLSYDQSN